AFSWNGAGTVMTFTPNAALATGTGYTASIAASATDLAGNPLASPASWSFTTAAAGDTTPPTVAGTDPANSATNVAANSNILIGFSEPMNKTATQAALSVSPTVAGAFSWNGAGTILTFNPNA